MLKWLVFLTAILGQISSVTIVSAQTPNASPPPVTSIIELLPADALAGVWVKPSALIYQTEQEILGDIPFLNYSPVPPSQIDEVIGWFSLSLRHPAPIPCLCLRFHQPIHSGLLVKWLSPGATRASGYPFPVFRKAQFGSDLAIIDPRTVLVLPGLEELEVVLSARTIPLDRRPLAAYFASLDRNINLAASADIGRVRFLGDMASVDTPAPPDFDTFLALPRELGAVNIAAHFGKKSNELRIGFTKRTDVIDQGSLERWIPNAIVDVKKMIGLLVAQVKKRMPPDGLPSVANVEKLVLDYLAELKPELNGNLIGLSDHHLPSFTRTMRGAGEMMLPAVLLARTAARESLQQNSMKQVVLAWQNYVDKHQKAPHDIRDEQGKLLLSWRVQLLPFLDQEELYHQFHLREPWDSEHNRQLLARMPRVYQHSTANTDGRTSIQSVLGPRTVFTDGVGLREIRDGASNTVVFVETAEPVEWTRPVDYQLPESDISSGLKKYPNGTSMFGFADGSVQRHVRQPDETYRKLFEYADGGVIELADERPSFPEPAAPKLNADQSLALLDTIDLKDRVAIRAAFHDLYRHLEEYEKVQVQQDISGVPAEPALLERNKRYRAGIQQGLQKLLVSSDVYVRGWSALLYIRTSGRSSVPESVLAGFRNETNPDLRNRLSEILGESRTGPVVASQSRMKQVLLGWFNFYDVKQHFPTDIKSADGKPLLSWRVSVLPFIEQQELYNRFHLDEPWDSPHNRELIPLIPQIYRETLPERQKYSTHLQAVTGKGTVFGDNAKIQQITDGMSGTLVMIEAAEPVIWTQPGDFLPPATQIEKALQRGSDGRIYLGSADGSAEGIEHVNDSGFLRTTTYAGGEQPLINQRDQLWQSAQKLVKEKQFKAAVETGLKMLKIEENLFGETNDDVLQSLGWLSTTSAQIPDLDAARQYRATWVDRFVKRYGPDDWHTMTARDEQLQFDLDVRLTPAQRETMKKVGELGEAVAAEVKQNHQAEALKITKERLELVQTVYGPESSFYIGILRDLRTLSYRTGDLAAAVAAAKQVLEMGTRTHGAKSPQTINEQAEYLWMLGQAGNRDVAEKELRAILEPILELKKPELARRVCLLLAQQSIRRGEFMRAYADYGEAIRMTDAMGQETESILMCEQFGQQLVSAGNLELAKIVLFEAIWRAEYSNNRIPFRGLYGELADVMNGQGKPHLELTLRDVHLSIIEAVPQNARSTNEVPLALLRRGQVALVLGDFVTGERFSNLVMEQIRQTNKQAEPPIAVLTAMADVLKYRNDPATAENLLKRALQQAEQQPANPRLAVDSHRVLGDFLMEQGRSLDALPHVKAVASRPAEATFTFLIDKTKYARVLHETGDPTEAIKIAHELHTSTTYPQEPARFDHRLALELAELLQMCEDATSAQQWSQRAVESCRARVGTESQLYADCLTRTALLSFARGEHDLARQQAKDAMDCAARILDHSMYILSPRQQTLLRENTRQSLDVFLSVAAKDPAAGRDLFSAIYAWKGVAQLRQRNLQNLMQQQEVKSFYGQLSNTTQRLMRSSQQAAAPANPQDAEQHRLEQQVQTLSDLKELLEQRLSAAQLAYLDAMPTQTLEQFLKAIPKNAAFVDYFVYRQSSVGTIHGELSVMATVVRPDGKYHAVPLGSLADVQNEIGVWRASYGRSTEGQQAGNDLRKRLWEPLLTHIGNAKLLLVSPDAALGQLPFAALPGSKVETYLIQDYPIVTIPVPQLIAQVLSPADSKTPMSMLLVGDIDYESADSDGAPATAQADRAIMTAVRSSGQRFTALPGTAAELVGISKLANAPRSKKAGDKSQPMTTLTQRHATESAFRKLAPQHPVLHVATHGYFAEARGHAANPNAVSASKPSETLAEYHPGLLSGIAFAGANHDDPKSADDGILTADEIASLPLSNVSLAVLSACETGIGQVTQGDGLIGVQRAFQIAGARTTVASLWKVNDQATQVLMTRFYKNLLEGKKNRVEALREAQLWMLANPKAVWEVPIEETRGVRRAATEQRDDSKSKVLSPEFWAAFVLCGDWN